MENTQQLTFWKKPVFLLSLILVVFFLKGIFLAVLHPIFVGQDEARHYSTIQYIVEPKEKNWLVDERKHINDKHSIKDYNFSQEIVETGLATDLDIIREENYNTQLFSNNYNGKNEDIINLTNWKRINEFYYPDTAPSTAYHYLASLVERFFSESSILFRFYLIRLFSVLLGMIVLLIYYFTAKNIGFSEKNSLLLTAIISFQPRFSIYYGSINYDALLILSFALFTLGGSLALKNDLHWKNLGIMLGAIMLGLLTKGTSLVLLAMFMFFLLLTIYRKIKRKQISRKKVLALLALIVLILIISQSQFDIISTLLSFNNDATSKGSSSLSGYLAKSFTFTRFDMMVQTYWGNLSWSVNYFYEVLRSAFWIIEIISILGIALFIFSKNKLKFLPEKKYIFFLLAMVTILQLSIRFYDWKVFSATGGLNLGTPGRYFIPNIFPHFVIIFTALGFLLRKRKYFNDSLKIGLIAMFIFSMYLILDIIMPRFYL